MKKSLGHSGERERMKKNAIKDERKKCLSWKRLVVVIMLVFPRVTYNERGWMGK